MSYYFSRTIQGGFDDVVGRTREALKEEGFGVITEIDAEAALTSGTMRR